MEDIILQIFGLRLKRGYVLLAWNEGEVVCLVLLGTKVS